VQVSQQREPIDGAVDVAARVHEHLQMGKEIGLNKMNTATIRFFTLPSTKDSLITVLGLRVNP